MAIKKHNIAGQEVDWDTVEGAPVNHFSGPKKEAAPVDKSAAAALKDTVPKSVAKAAGAPAIV